MYASVRTRLEMPWMVRKIGVFTVFNNEPSIFF